MNRRGRAAASVFAAFVAMAVASCSAHDHGPSVEQGGGLPVAPRTVTPDYPPGPYGFAIGATFPNVTVQGYVAGAAPWTNIVLKDYYDPGKSKGIDGLYVTVSAPWCSTCQLEGRAMPGLYTALYRGRGARFLTVLLQGPDHEPSSQATVDAWVSAYRTPYDVAMGLAPEVLAQPGAPGAANGLPWNYVIDPRRMTVVAINQGDYFNGDNIPGLDALLATNAGP